MPLDDGYRKVDPAVLKRLGRLDKDLFVTHSRYVINPLDGRVLEVAPGVVDDAGNDIGGQPVEDPMFYLWIKNGDGRTTLVQMTEDFGHPEVAKLEGALSRFMNPGEVLKRMMTAREDAMRKAEEEHKELHLEKTKANHGRAKDLLEGKTGMRERKVASYAGQGDRSTPTERFLPDAKEDGWEGLDEN